ncbi:MAG: cystathionine beta-lyase, partial [Litorimonas sp.]
MPDMKAATKFTHLNRPKIGLSTPVNHPITRASTLLFERAEDLYRSDVRGYGRHGTQVHEALADMFTELEGGVGTVLFPSGLAACTYPILAMVKSGDHILLTDSSYGPVRNFCLRHLKQMGIETEIYDPHIGEGISALIRDNTSLIIMESPGSLTFEIQDVPAIVKAAKVRGVTTLIDNTWSAGLVYKPIELGVDISCHAATKYYGGHSDVMYGAAICASDAILTRVTNTAKDLGNSSSPDDANQVLRGFRTIIQRFSHQQASALRIATWLSTHSKVARVLHPALAEHPDHELWARDFTGAACIFSVVLEATSDADVLKFINALKLFGIGFSYGGFESLAIHCDPQLRRKHASDLGGPLVRFACGL